MKNHSTVMAEYICNSGRRLAAAKMRSTGAQYVPTE